MSLPSDAGSIADLTPGLRDPVHDAQRSYRVLLDAMSRPGRIHTLPAEALAALQPPAALGAGMAAVLLTLLDAETSVALLGRYADAAARRWLRFHTGVCDEAAATAAFSVLHAADASAGLWSLLPRGSDEAPQLGATLLVEVPALQARAGRDALVLRGPGIAERHHLRVEGLPRTFWAERIALERIAPRGVDLVLVAGASVAAIPRSTRLGWEE